MTDIKRRKVALRGLLVSLALVALVAAAVDPAAQAGPPTPDDRSAAMHWPTGPSVRGTWP